MPFNSYPYELPPLPYPYNALEPYIDTETMHVHHDKHFATYVTKLNTALAPYPKLQELTIDELFTAKLPESSRETILNNAGGVYNHAAFFALLSPEQHTDPALNAKIIRKFGSLERFKKEFSNTALNVFGSGWVALVLSRNGNPEIKVLKNQENVLNPIILFDVWEHAYYLKYKNMRADYVNQLWNAIGLRF